MALTVAGGSTVDRQVAPVAYRLLDNQHHGAAYRQCLAVNRYLWLAGLPFAPPDGIVDHLGHGVQVVRYVHGTIIAMSLTTLPNPGRSTAGRTARNSVVAYHPVSL